ncbi:MAG: hypothetical protein JRN00_05905, partial [Nitrososphaerota archaeon]|nr:hypothetical protein [Nitrososphaerota archaeon]
MTETIAFGGTTVEIETNEYNLIRVKFNGIATRWRYNPGEPFDMVLQDLIAMRAFDPIQDE